MPSYLRGRSKSAKYASYSAPTYQNQINVLKRQINKQKPAKVYYREAYETSASAGFGHTDHNLTGDFIASTNFRSLVNGDRWNNVYLRLNAVVDKTCNSFRVIVYVPKVTGASYNPGTTVSDIPRILDPAAFWVLADVMVDLKADLGDPSFQRLVKLNNLMTIYNTSSGVLEKGQIRMCCIWNKTTTAVPYHISAMLCMTDK